MNAKNLAFTSLEEAQNYFGRKDVNKMDIREAVETKYVVKSILSVLQQNEAPGIITNFWYMLGCLTEERLKTLGYKVMDMNLDDFVKIVHVVPEDFMRSQPHIVARQMFEDVDDGQLDELMNQALDERPLNKDLLNMLRTEYARRHKLN
ncbi:MAG: hypothetical protein KHX55_01015 [Proteobacteria bacterium]|nr:hypothetical protein [Pseudomonadota bacterium]